MLRLRYEYVGQLDPISRKIVGARQFTWIQELRLDTTTLRGDAVVLGRSGRPDDSTGGQGRDHRARRGGARRRRIAGDFHVRVPLVGGTAERRIVPGLVRRLDVEAAAVAMEL